MSTTISAKHAKHAAITLTKTGRAFALHFCTAPRRSGEGSGSGVTLLDRIASGKSPRELAQLAAEMGLVVWSPPSPKSEYKMRGAKQADGSIVDPVLDWDGILIRNEVRTPAIPAHLQ